MSLYGLCTGILMNHEVIGWHHKRGSPSVAVHQTFPEVYHVVTGRWALIIQWKYRSSPLFPDSTYKIPVVTDLQCIFCQTYWWLPSESFPSLHRIWQIPLSLWLVLIMNLRWLPSRSFQCVWLLHPSPGTPTDHSSLFLLVLALVQKRCRSKVVWRSSSHSEWLLQSWWWWIQSWEEYELFLGL